MAVRDFSNLRLGQITKRKNGSLQLLLRHLEQKVGLILRQIESLFESKPASFLVIFNAGVMPGGHTIRSHLSCDIDELGELQLGVAGHTRNGGPTTKIVLNEGSDN